MSLLSQQTNVNQNEYFFLKANAQLINVSTINAGNVFAGQVSTSVLDANAANFSTTFAYEMFIDNQGLTATPTELLLNGVPIATTANLSSIGDWAIYPAISTVQMAGNDLNAAGTISSGNVRAGNGLFNNLIAFNALFVSTATSTLSTQINTADLGFYSTLNGGNISTPQIINLSSINGFPISHYEPGAVSTISTFTDLTTSSLFVSSINGSEFTSTGISVQVAGVSSLVSNSISSLGAEIKTALVSTIQFKPEFKLDLNFDFAALGSGIKSGLTNIGIGLGGGLVAIASGIVASATARKQNTTIVQNTFEQYCLPTQIQFSTLNNTVSSFSRYVSSSGEPNTVPGLEYLVSTIIPAGTLCIRSIGDPVNLADPSTVTSSIQSFGQWTSVPVTIPSSISSLTEWALYPALSTIDANGNDILNARIVNCSTIDVPLLNGGIISTGQITNCSSMNAGVISTAYIQGANSNLFGLGLQGLEIDATNLFLSTPSVVHPGSFNGSTILANSAIVKQSGVSSLTASTITTNLLSTSLVQSGLFLVSSFNINVLATISTTNTAILNAELISSGRFTASSISLNSGVYSTLLVPQVTPNPGVGTSSCLFVNTDVNLGTNDLYAQQVRLGKGVVDNFAEILMYANDGSTRNLLAGTADRTFRVASSVAPTGPGYVLDTTMNPPFFSTINQSTAMMSYFPSTINNTIGVSTIGYIPPKIVAGAFTSLSTQNMTINTPLALWMEQTDYTVGGLVTSTNTIVVPSNGVFEIIPSIQFEHPLGAATADFWLRKNGSDVPNTASEVYLPTGGNGQTLGVTSYILPCSAGDKLQIMVASPDTGCSVAFFQSTVTTPYTKPANPSVIVSMKCLNY